MIIIYSYFKPLDSGKWDFSFTVYWPQFSLSYYALSSRYFTEIVEKKKLWKIVLLVYFSKLSKAKILRDNHRKVYFKKLDQKSESSRR